MATWHQEQADKRNSPRLLHETDWTVVIDPPNQMRALYRTSSKANAEVYMCGLKEHNAGAARYAYILPPATHYRKRAK